MNTKKLRVDSKAEYTIRISGHLDESWSDRLNGMTIKTRKTGGPKPVTTLVGLLRDQAALLGVLNTLYNLRLPLISVELHFPEGK